LHIDFQIKNPYLADAIKAVFRDLSCRGGCKVIKTKLKELNQICQFRKLNCKVKPINMP